MVFPIFNYFSATGLLKSPYHNSGVQSYSGSLYLAALGQQLCGCCVPSDTARPKRQYPEDGGHPAHTSGSGYGLHIQNLADALQKSSGGRPPG